MKLNNLIARSVASAVLTTGLMFSVEAWAARGGGGGGGSGTDKTAPKVSITSQPSSYINTTSASVSFSATDSGRRASGVAYTECSLNGANYSVCTSPMSLTNLLEKNHSLAIRARDNSGNISTPVVANFTVDLTSPSVAFTSVPLSSSPSTSVEFQFSSTDNTNISSTVCSLDASAFSACQSPVVLSNLATGSHTFAVRVTDLAGNSSQASYTFNIEQVLSDLIPPTVAITSQPNAFINSTSASVGFSANDTGGSGLNRTECSLNGAAYSTCVSPLNLSGLAQAKHTVNVRAFDNAGNVSSAASTSFTVDTSKPTITLTAMPPATTTSTSASFSFTVTDTNSITSRQCSLDGAAYAGCTSPMAYTVSTGVHTFNLRATDIAGNVATASYTWTVEVAPTIDWVINIPLEFYVGTGLSIDLKPTLPIGILANGTFSVDSTGTPLPLGMSLSPDGLLNVGTAGATDVTGIIFAYTEP